MKYEFRGLSGRRLEFEDLRATVLWQEKQGHARVVRTDTGHYVYMFNLGGPSVTAEELSDHQMLHMLRKLGTTDLTEDGLTLMEAAGWTEEE